MGYMRDLVLAKIAKIQQQPKQQQPQPQRPIVNVDENAALKAQVERLIMEKKALQEQLMELQEKMPRVKRK
jgi:hypothetical protein